MTVAPNVALFLATHERPVLNRACVLLRERLALVESEIARRP
jgi:hypothetical protein